MAKGAVENRIIRNMTTFLVENLMKKNNCSRDDALTLLMKTSTFEALMDIETDLYLESKESVWHILSEELAGNYDALLVV